MSQLTLAWAVNQSRRVFKAEKKQVHPEDVSSAGTDGGGSPYTHGCLLPPNWTTFMGTPMSTPAVQPRYHTAGFMGSMRPSCVKFFSVCRGWGRWSWGVSSVGASVPMVVFGRIGAGAQ